MPRRLLPPLACLLLLPLRAHAAGDGYALDPVHTRVLFAVSHAGFSQALGTVSGSGGQLWFDPADWAGAKLAVTVPLARLDLGDAGWNRAASARNLLDVAHYPVATFVSNRIAPRDAQHAQVCGDLTLHGVRRDTCLDVTFNQLRRHPLPPFRRTAGFSATTTLSRKDFGIDAWPTVIGDRIQLRIEAEAVRDGGVSAGSIGLRADDATSQTPAPEARQAPPANPLPTPP
ncbi:MAG: polyisoprenoid-binding protein [Lysobacter sp.]|nr:polyisoprenoid-binding protein [Lysobacter sp.]